MAEGSSDPPQLTQDGPSHQKRYGHGSRRGRPRPARHTNLNVDSHIAAKPHGHFQLGSKTNFYDHDGTAGGQNYQHHYQHEEGSRGRGRGGGGRGGRGRGWGNHGSNRGGLLGFTGGVGGPGPRWQRPGGDEGPYGGSSRISAFSGSGHPQSERPDCPGWHREDVGHDPGQANEHQSTRTKRPNRFNQEQGGGEPGIRGIRDAHRRENQNQAAVRDLGFSGLRAGNQHSNFRESSQRSWRGAESTHSDHHRKHFEPNRRQGPIKPPKPFPEVEPGSGSDATAGDEPRQPGRRGWGRQPPPQDRGPRRAPHQEHRPSQKKWDHVPKSKETQTGCLIEQLSEEKYECMVCCDVIRLMAPVWSCQGCHHVFHLNCVKKWARSPASQADDSTEGWRCPACQNVSVKHPTSYTCFCGKVTNPEWRPTEIPHSCGDLCGKKRSSLDCKHACNILCHPGPCPQCPAFITKSCVCGRTSQPMRCGQATVLRCNAVCGAALNCAQHTCPEVCHTAPCQPCQLLVQQVCYCGVASREVLCGTDKEGFDGTGHFSCQKECGKTLDCQAHQCQQLCHTGPCQPCPRSPSLVKTCPCGQTALAKLLELGYPERRSCSDPVPSCGKTCSNPLVCGSNDTFHFCDLLCHEGSCGPCSLTSTVRCRCGSKTKEVPCASIQKEEELVFTCDKRCSKKRACGRHKCTELCCVNAEHKCPLICSYKLNCGLHRCQEPCHRGNCGPCWQASFEELTCHCGQSVLYPPVACGTLPPECKNLCTRRHECEHPVFHNCHSDERCPPCTYLTQKWCMGNHEQRSNIPCHLQDISCGLTCNKTLPCHMHRCRRICHRGDCLAEGTCTQPCAKPRPDCAHPCAALCHWGSDCPRNACTAKVALQCDCGRRKETVMCPEAASSYQRYAAIAMASKLSDMQQGDSVDIGQFITKKELKQARLECDQECATLERNRCLAEALQIDPSVDPFNIRSTSKYSDSLKDDARKELKFVSDVEKEIKNLVELANKGKVSRRSHCFPPMKRDHRKMVHELAEAYGVESVSYDTEPKRNVVVTAIKGKSLCPNTTLTALIERESSARAPPPIAHIKQHSSKADGGGSWSKMVKEEPLIDYFDVQD